MLWFLYEEVCVLEEKKTKIEFLNNYKKWIKKMIWNYIKKYESVNKEED